MVPFDWLNTFLEHLCADLMPTKEELEKWDSALEKTLRLLRDAIPWARPLPFGSYVRNTLVTSRLVPQVDIDILLIEKHIPVDDVFLFSERHGVNIYQQRRDLIYSRLIAAGVGAVEISEPSFCFWVDGIKFEITPVYDMPSSKEGEDLDPHAEFVVQWPLSFSHARNPALTSLYNGNCLSTGSHEGALVVGTTRPNFLLGAAAWCSRKYPKGHWLRLLRLLKFWNARSCAGLVSYELEFIFFIYLAGNADRLSTIACTFDLLVDFIRSIEAYRSTINWKNRKMSENDEETFYECWNPLALYESSAYQTLRDNVLSAARAAEEHDFLYAVALLAEVIDLPRAPRDFWTYLIGDSQKSALFCEDMLRGAHSVGLGGRAFILD